MSTFANQLKGEISRLAKKEVRAETVALKKASVQYRSEIATLKKRLAEMEAQCWHRSNIDHLCRLNFDQGLLSAV